MSTALIIIIRTRVSHTLVVGDATLPCRSAPTH